MHVLCDEAFTEMHARFSHLSSVCVHLCSSKRHCDTAAYFIVTVPMIKHLPFLTGEGLCACTALRELRFGFNGRGSAVRCC